MLTLKLSLLGPSQINLNEESVTGFTTNKAPALLFYLAVTGQSHTRHALAALLWSDASDRQARKNLRNVLYDLRPLVGPYLNITSQAVSFNRNSAYWLDVEVFTTGVEASSLQSVARLNEIIGLYRGDFLEGFHVRNAGAFEEWVLMQQEYLKNLLLQGLNTLTRRCLEEQEYTLGLAAARRLLALEPWRETTHRRQMLFLAHTGQRQAALVQYETCRRVLAEELDISPLVETTALYEQLKSGQLSAPPKSGGAALTVREAAQPARSCLPAPASTPESGNGAAPRPPVDWGAAPIQTPFYGRRVELNRLAGWLVRDGCRLAAIFGIGGQGKTALTVQLTEALAQNRLPDGSNLDSGGFDRIIWRSARNAPPFAALLQDWLQPLTGQAPASIPDQVDAQLGLLEEQLRRQRCLLILDDFNSLLDEADCEQVRPGYAAYEQLLARIAHVEHQSCLLLVSREQPRAFQHLAVDSATVRSLPLTGLVPETGREILQAFGLAGSQEAAATLIRRYSGNPLALKLAAMTIQNFFAGRIDHFVQEDALIFDDLHAMLERQLAPLSQLEREIMNRLALDQKPVAFQSLQRDVAQAVPKREFLTALQALQRRCLLEKYGDGFAIQNLMAEYLIDGFIETICREIETEEFLDRAVSRGTAAETAVTPTSTATFLSRYELVKSQRPHSCQPGRLLHQVTAHLTARWGADGLKQHLNHLLTIVESEGTQPRGYAGVNLYHILNTISGIGTPGSFSENQASSTNEIRHTKQAP